MYKAKDIDDALAKALRLIGDGGAGPQGVRHADGAGRVSSTRDEGFNFFNFVS
jgi:hypothetical protein